MVCPDLLARGLHFIPPSFPQFVGKDHKASSICCCSGDVIAGSLEGLASLPFLRPLFFFDLSPTYNIFFLFSLLFLPPKLEE